MPLLSEDVSDSPPLPLNTSVPCSQSLVRAALVTVAMLFRYPVARSYAQTRCSKNVLARGTITLCPNAIPD